MDQEWYGHAYVENGDIVIRVPIKLLPNIVSVGIEGGFIVPGYEVSDPETFAEDVCLELNQEDEDGTTAIHRLFDKGFELAIENGSEGVMEVQIPIEEF